MSFVANFIRFPVAQNVENRLRFDKVTESLNVGTFLRHSVYTRTYTGREREIRSRFVDTNTTIITMTADNDKQTDRVEARCSHVRTARRSRCPASMEVHFQPTVITN